MSSETYDYVVGGTSGCVIAGRLAEDLNVAVCVIEAGPDNADLENVHMVGGWSQNFDCETDWNITSEPSPGINGRQVKNSRGRFLGGCSGVNGTLCIRGNRQDYDDWGLEGWSGEDMFKSMAKNGVGELRVTCLRLGDALSPVPDDLLATFYASIPVGGIGPKVELEQHGIQPLVELPGVGKNLMDHAITFVFYETSKPELTNDRLAYYEGALASSYQLYKDKKSGFLSTFPFGAFGYARVDDRLKDLEPWKNASPTNDPQGRPYGAERDPMGLLPTQPNIEWFSTECYGGPKQYDRFPTDGQGTFAMVNMLLSPRARGSVTLKSTDPTANPVVDHNYLGDELDALVMAEACRWGNEIVMKGEGTKDVVKGAWPSGEKHHEYTTREQWIEYAKEHSTTCYHAAGTCKMGKDDDPLAVLDARLRVRGVEKLRVADCSVMPLMNQGHTQMPAYGIGEKAADLVKEDTKNLPNMRPDSAVATVA
ncbi:putative gmc oxidoreductase protein [Neofusicoccum parvum UCRNP2]|uniref:Putative gmc oxidoreductase protein n=1 Tax=Botryosphaeria parva (strain UCR-NP2) TaxID=1287680 RepID=R1EBE2_BOTPV|nr:putative gmc oxidoreductase protein [Neofusicoccum parvum UCRNP2]